MLPFAVPLTQPETGPPVNEPKSVGDKECNAFNWASVDPLASALNAIATSFFVAPLPPAVNVTPAKVTVSPETKSLNTAVAVAVLAAPLVVVIVGVVDAVLVRSGTST